MIKYAIAAYDWKAVRKRKPSWSWVDYNPWGKRSGRANWERLCDHWERKGQGEKTDRRGFLSLSEIYWNIINLHVAEQSRVRKLPSWALLLFFRRPKSVFEQADADEALQAALPALESAARALEERGVKWSEDSENYVTLICRFQELQLVGSAILKLFEELDKKDITEVKGMASPPPPVTIVSRLNEALTLIWPHGRQHWDPNMEATYCINCN